MSERPLVSVIMIFLNAEAFIEEAIDSVLAQSYTHWELLLVDDGSIDSSTRIAQRYVNEHPNRVRYLSHAHHQNHGMSASRNLGIRNARGEYIAFLDADDTWLPFKLEKQVAILSTEPQAGMVFGSTWFWYSWAGNPAPHPPDSMREVAPEYDRLFAPPDMLTLFLRRKALTPATCSVLIRREVFTTVGGFEEAFRGMYEDVVFFSKVYLKTPVFPISTCCDRYRQHSESSVYVAERAGEYHPYKPNPSHLAYLNWLIQYVAIEGVADAQVLNPLRRQLWRCRHPVLYAVLVAAKTHALRISGGVQRLARRVLPILRM